MNFSEFIGFIITIAAMIYMSYKQIRAERAPEDDDEVVKEESSEVKELLRSLNIDVRDEVAVPKLPPKAPPKAKSPVQHAVREVVQAAKMMPMQPVSSTHYDSIDDGNDLLNLPSLIPLEYSLPTAPSQAKQIAGNIGVQKMIIIHELLSTPKGLQP
jgi:hypothetical protein